MARYIDADLLKEAIFAKWYTCEEIDETIDRMPTVDVVEVVLCKDCEFFRGNAQEGGCQQHKLFVKAVKADDYCSCGERRTE